MSKLSKDQRKTIVGVVEKYHEFLKEKLEQMEKMIELKEALINILPKKTAQEAIRANAKDDKNIPKKIKELKKEVKDAEAIEKFIKIAVKK